MIIGKEDNRMIRKMGIYVLTIICIILTIFAVTSAAIETTLSASISDLNTGNNGTDYTSADIALDTSMQGTNGATVSNIVRFVTVGDPHLTNNINNDQYRRLTKAVNYINGRSDIDFVVIMGDIVETATTNNFVVAKNLLSTLNKPYYVIPGNHDIGSSISKFNVYFGPVERVVNVNGYQLIFVSISKDAHGINHWSFDYSKADKSKPTVIFNHGPVQKKPGTTSCSGWKSYAYSCDMKSNVDSFTKLLGYYNGHAHVATNQLIGGERYVTADNLGGFGGASNYIGYTVIQNNVLTYKTVTY
jgi:predicted phosphodiesterase